MDKSTIYSIGHGSKSIEKFINELKSFGIKYLIDIRSKPFSKYYPHFNQSELKFALEKSAITYVFLGEQLGGLPSDPTCYTEGKVDYEKLKKKDFFKAGLKSLITANEKSIPLVIMCSESKPQECHRSKLIGEELLLNDISINHIIDENKSKDQLTVMSEVTKGLGLINLFNEEATFTSRKNTDNMKFDFFTIGVYRATEETFFKKLVENNIDTFLDIRRRRGVRGSKYSYVNSNKLQEKRATTEVSITQSSKK